ncbi:MAG: metal-dependent transcriptional regulator, partial [Actinobacteria bacterium]|nr:metal-dependent transcriptional regulator [Actinomycetota bacterium]
MIPSTERHPAFEEYCECIFELHEDDLDVIRARIAERLNVSRASVSQMIEKMTKVGLVTSDANNIALTDEGLRLANQVVRRHRLAERFLTDILGLSWSDAHREAGKWEHVMSDEVEAAMNRVLGAPTTCPHGNPIPGSSYIDPEAVPLKLAHGQATNAQLGEDFLGNSPARIRDPDREPLRGCIDLDEDLALALD